MINERSMAIHFTWGKQNLKMISNYRMKPKRGEIEEKAKAKFLLHRALKSFIISLRRLWQLKCVTRLLRPVSWPLFAPSGGISHPRDEDHLYLFWLSPNRRTIHLYSPSNQRLAEKRAPGENVTTHICAALSLSPVLHFISISVNLNNKS